MDLTTIDISNPRRRYYSDDFGLDSCPECGGNLVNQNCTIILCAKSKTDDARFMTNLTGSHFCEKCPVVVFDNEKVEQAAILGIRGNKNLRYVIAGIIDMDAIPEEKRDLEMGCDENPIILVPFLPDLNTNTIVSEKERGRNESCICGSGLKYKKCCGKV
jgi:hypothetical protein